MKPNPTSSMQRATRSGARSIRAPSASSRSAEPERLGAERLPCLATAHPVAAAISAAVVDEPVARYRDRRRERAHRAREPDDLIDGFALCAQGDQEPRDLGVRDLAGHDLGENLRRLLGAEVSA